MGRILFVTGTDTGVGKTLLTALLLAHLRSSGVAALAHKPFCSGGRHDAELLCALQNGELSLDEVNPYSFAEPVAPLVAARKHRKRISLDDILRTIQSLSGRCECLLVEGAGGLLAPLGEGFSARDIIRRLRCESIVVAANRLGAINHTMLTVHALQSWPDLPRPRVVLMNHRQTDTSSRTNDKVLREMLDPVPVSTILFLGSHTARPEFITWHERKLRKVLALVVGGN